MLANRDKYIGKTLDRVRLDRHQDRITFEFQDGGKLALQAEGDCCSSSWIEHVEAPNANHIRGAKLLSIIEDHTGNDLGPGQDNWGNDSSCVQQYQTIFRTTAGDIAVEYRNASNGFYGGYLCQVYP